MRLEQSHAQHATAAHERGVYLVELVLAIPILLAFVFFFLWIAIYVHLCANFVTSVNNGVRLGASRGDSEAMGYNSRSAQPGLIPALHRTPFWSPEVFDLYCHGVSTSDCKAYYDAWSNLLFQRDFENIQKEGQYAIAYTLEALLIGSGESAVRYPCAPEGDPRTNDGGDGCIDCRILPSGVFGEVPAGKLRLVLDCRFQPDSYLFNVIMNLVSREGLSTRRFLLTRQMFFDRAVFNQ